MQTTYTYAVIRRDGSTVNVRADRTVLETCTPSGKCTEQTIVDFTQD